MSDTDNKQKKHTPKYVVPDDVREQVKEFLTEFLKDNKSNINQLSKDLNDKYPDKNESRSNLCNKLARGSLKATELVEILQLHGYELSWKKARKS